MLAAGEENGTAKRDAQCSVERDNERTGGAELGEEQVATEGCEGCGWVACRGGE